MSEEEKINQLTNTSSQSSQNNPVNKEPELVNENETSEINTPEIKTMEVHHHPQVEKKTFKEYLFEGIMIFIAVTMGFIAENIRENITENRKSKEIAASLYNEVYADSIAIQKKIKLRLLKEAEMVYLREYFKDSSLQNISQRASIAMVWTFILVNQSLFEPKDGILSQLKNSSSTKFFKTSELQNMVGDLGVAIARLRIRNDQEYNFVQAFLRPYVLKHFDFIWFDQFTENGNISNIEALFKKEHPNLAYHINDLPDLKRNESESLIAYYLLLGRGTRQLLYQDYISANHKLLEALRSNYYLEKK